jgi:hypothetical protein
MDGRRENLISNRANRRGSSATVTGSAQITCCGRSYGSTKSHEPTRNAATYRIDQRSNSSFDTPASAVGSRPPRTSSPRSGLNNRSYYCGAERDSFRS